MPFDSANYPGRKGDGDPRRASGTAAVVIIIILFGLLMLTPFSLPAFVDLVHYLQGG